MVVICCNTVSWHMVKLSNQWLNNLFDSNLFDRNTMTSLWFDRAFYCVLFHPVFLFETSRSLKHFETGVVQNDRFVEWLGQQVSCLFRAIKQLSLGVHPPWKIPMVTFLPSRGRSQAFNDFCNLDLWWIQSFRELDPIFSYWKRFQYSVKYTEICRFMDPIWELNHQMRGTSPGPDPVAGSSPVPLRSLTAAGQIVCHVGSAGLLQLSGGSLKSVKLKSVSHMVGTMDMPYETTRIFKKLG